MKHRAIFLMILFSLSTLAACGGGGDDCTTSPGVSANMEASQGKLFEDNDGDGLDDESGLPNSFGTNNSNQNNDDFTDFSGNSHCRGVVTPGL